MLAQYNKKFHQLEKAIQEGQFSAGPVLLDFCKRLCSPPFSRSLSSASIWLELWPLLSLEGKSVLHGLPDPCLNHVESRLRKPERAANLKVGLKRFLCHDEELFLEALRLYPHALCRTAETIGPFDDQMWRELEKLLRSHRLWNVEASVNDKEFWKTAEYLKDYRDLPQAILDFLDLDRPKDKAPVEDFRTSLQRFLVREKVEKMRHASYEMLRSQNSDPALELSSKS